MNQRVAGIIKKSNPQAPGRALFKTGESGFNEENVSM
jgi:hypothetical protein